jgi:excisionase family DNA binding protein
VDDLLTTRQLQELLQVDRITIYRMLKDGRLRGFKVGGQWRFSHGEIEAWLQEQQVRLGQMPESPSPAENTTPIAQMLPISCVRAIQAVCADAMDVAVVTTESDGTPLCNISNSCGFCNLVLSSESGRQRCASSWGQQSSGEIYLCHAGLLCASAPIEMAGRVVAISAACQFTALARGGTEPAWQPHIAELAGDLGLIETDLRAATGTVRAMPQNQVLRISELVGRVAETFAEIGQERLNLLGRLEKIAEMSKL